MYNPKEPYNELPLLPPDINIITQRIFNKAMKANRALAEMKGVCEILPNPAMLINTLDAKCSISDL